MLKRLNNKRNITILIGILVAIAILFSSFGPISAEGTSSFMTGVVPEIHFSVPVHNMVIKILSPF